MGKLTTTNLIESIAATMDLPKKDVSRMMDGLKAVMTTALNEDKSVTLAGIGTFKPKHLAARKGRNPSTGETIDIAAKNGIGFKPASTLKEALNQ